MIDDNLIDYKHILKSCINNLIITKLTKFCFNVLDENNIKYFLHKNDILQIFLGLFIYVKKFISSIVSFQSLTIIALFITIVFLLVIIRFIRVHLKYNDCS